MRGVPSRLQACSAALVVAFLLVPAGAAAALVPAAAEDVTAPTVPDIGMPAGMTDDPCEVECPFGPRIEAILQEAPVDALPRLLMGALGPVPADAPPAPHQVPGYDALGPDLQRDLWRVWATGTVMRAALPVDPFGTSPVGASAASSEAASGGDDLGTPFGVRELWRVESHGEPRYVLPAGDDGETYLVTSRGVLRFDAPGAAPDWMVKPGGYLSRVETADANGDGVLDLVIGSYSFATADDASVLVVDGRDGSVLFRGMGGEDRYLTWTLTDIDGDGQQEVLGLTGMLELVAIGLDGSERYRSAITELPSPGPVGFLLVYVFLFYDSFGGGMFGDVNGDGVDDLFVLSAFWGFIFALVVAQSYEQSFVTTYSGVDGSVIWTAPGTPSAGSSYFFPLATGDMDGDGADDLLGMRYEFSYATMVFSFSYGYDVLSGSDGHRLARDDYSFTCAVIICPPLDVSMLMYTPLAFVDIDRDGAEELLTVEARYTERGIESMDVVARGPAPTGFIDSMELYRHPVESGGFEYLDADFRVRDVDQDGGDELLLVVLGYDADSKGNVTAAGTSVSAIGPGGVASFTTPRLVGNYDIDENTGQAYGWTLPDDRWVPLDDEGNRIGRGLRMVVSPYPVIIDEHTGDGVPDVLLPKAMGFMWVDGRTGKLLEDVERPAGRYAVDVIKEAGELRVLERSHVTDRFYLASLATGEDVWSFKPEGRGFSWLFGYPDVTGDGRIDMATLQWECAETCWDEIRVYDMRTEERVLSERTDSWQFLFGDVAVDRRGEELLVVEEDPDDYSQVLRVVAPGLDAPLWTYPLGSNGYVSAVAEGTVLVHIYGEGLTLEFIHGATGEQLAAFATEADSWDTGVLLQDVDGDASAEAVVSYVTRNDRWEVTGQRVVVLDPDTAEELSSFDLSDPREVHVAYEGYVYQAYEPAYVTVSAGDWDGDGLVDFAFREQGTPVIRSTADGTPLAVAPMRGTPAVNHDLNGDGVPEIGVVSDYGALRFLAKAGSSFTMDREELVQVVADPESTQDGANGDFFVEESALPAPGVALVALALVGLAFVLRRRR